EDPVAKVFDNIAINSTSPLATMDLEVVNDTGTQTILGTIIAAMKEGVIVVKTLLYNNSRLRGNRMTTTVKWADTIATVSAVLTQYRRSPRTPFSNVLNTLFSTLTICPASNPGQGYC